MNLAKVRLLVSMTIAILLLTLVSACKKNIDSPIAPSEFTKTQRLELGKLLQSSIALDHDNFQILPNAPPFDTSLYWFTQTLYDQATNAMRLDFQSPEEDRWGDESWPITVLVDDEPNAFILPGGYFYITTGLLKSLETEHELYYILALEATLMNENFLLDRLISEINSSALIDLINGNASPGASPTKSLAVSLSSLAFDPEEVYDVDLLVGPTICNTSSWSRRGIETIIEKLTNLEGWLLYRPSYPDRQEIISTLTIDSDKNCGFLETNNPSNSGYQRYVLDVLN